MKYLILLLLLVISLLLLGCEPISDEVNKKTEPDGKVVYDVGGHKVEEVTINGHLYLMTHQYGPTISLTHAGHCPCTHN